MRSFSIRTKLLSAAFFLSVVFTLVIGFVIFWYLRNVLVVEKLSSTNKIAAAQVRELVGRFETYQMFTKMLGTRTRVQEYLLDTTESRRDELLGIFSEYSTDDPNLLAIYLMNNSGDTLISTDQSFVGQNYGFREYYKSAIAGKPAINLLLGKTSNEFGYYFSYPVVGRDNKIAGVLVAKVREAFVNTLLIEGELAKSETIMFTDEYGVVIFSNRPERLISSLGQLKSEEIAQLKNNDRFLGKEIKSLQYDLVRNAMIDYSEPKSIEMQDDEESRKESLYVEKVGQLPFFLVVESGFDQIEKTVLGVVVMMFLVVVGASLIIIWFGYWLFSSFIIKPLKKINEMANNVRAGDFSYRLDIKNNDEIGVLATTMNVMAEKLNTYYDDLAYQVKDKVEEIEKKNQQMNNQQKAILNILEDVAAEKKKVEDLANDLEKFRLAVEDSSDHIVITDPEGVVIYSNKALEKITGYSPKEALGKKAGILWKLPMPLEYYKKMWNTIKNKKQVFMSEIQNRRKNGELYTAAISITPVLNKLNEIIFFVGIERDITKEKQIDQAKTEFVSLASHQLRTPLSTINWYSEMLLNGDAGRLKPEQANYVEEIYRGNQRMVSLVNALLNVSRLELGTFAIEPKLCDIKKIADSAISDIDHKMFEKHIKFTKKYDKKIKDMMLDDKLTMIIFQNLLSNAVKYTLEKGKINLTIAVNGKKLLITVSDTGLGIPEAQQGKIFTKLFRADNVRKTDTEGTGLGLYIIKSVVENVGGKIWFESIENKGTSFYVTLPLSGMKQKTGTKSLS